jgi:hypothetical protein
VSCLARPPEVDGATQICRYALPPASRIGQSVWVGQGVDSSRWARAAFADGLTFEKLVALPGTEFSSFMMLVAAQRATHGEAEKLLSRYVNNRFVRPNPASPRALRRVEDTFIEVTASDFELVALAPVVPFGTHAQLTGISQNRVVSALRDVEVAADPTVGLAFEAALRRRESPRSSVPVCLAATQRVTRAQRFTAAATFTHFALGALVTAGRDTGSHQFEVDAMFAHVATYAELLRGLGQRAVTIAVTDLLNNSQGFVGEIAVRLRDELGVDAVVDGERIAGREYYAGVCFKVLVDDREGQVEVGDGGFVDWTARLTNSQKERCLASGISIERLALSVDEH